MNPKVSVIMAAYNSGDRIRETLQSVFRQTFTSYEIIIVDDGSTDHTPKVLSEYADRIMYERIPNSGGASTPRNKAIARARGEYLAFLDHDDVWVPEKLERQVAILDAHPDVGLVFTNFRTIFDNVPSPETWFDKPHVERDIAAIPQSAIGSDSFKFTRPIYADIVRDNFIGLSTVMMRKSLCDACGAFDTRWGSIEDLDMWMRTSQHGALFAGIRQELSYWHLSQAWQNATFHNETHRKRIAFWTCMFRQENDPALRHLMKNQYVLQLYRDYAFGLRLRHEYVKAAHWYLKGMVTAFLYGNSRYVGMLVCGMMKLPINIMADIVRGWLKRR